MEPEEVFALEVARVWLEGRVACPHRDVLEAYAEGSLEEGPRTFVAAHLEEVGCPSCRGDLAALRDRPAPRPSRKPSGAETPLPRKGLERALESTRAALRASRVRPQ